MSAYVEKSEHPKCFVSGCSRPRKYNEKGKHGGKYAQACKQCGNSPGGRTNASAGVRKYLKAQGAAAPPATSKASRHSTQKIEESMAREIYECCEYLLKNGLGVHDELVGEAFEVSRYSVMRIRLAPGTWKIPLPALKVLGGPRVKATDEQIMEVKKYLAVRLLPGGGITRKPQPEPEAGPDNVTRISDQTPDHQAEVERDGMDDFYDSQAIDSALKVVADAFESRDKEIYDLKEENALLRQSQTNQVYNAIADKILRRFGAHLKDKEGVELRDALERIMEQKPGAGE